MFAFCGLIARTIPGSRTIVLPPPKYRLLLVEPRAHTVPDE